MNPIFKIVIIIAIALGACQVAFIYSSKGLKNYNIHKNDRLTEIFLKNTNYPILFVGSSRTHKHVNPLIIDTITKLNSYNTGVEGGNLLEFKMTFDGYLESHPPPKLLVLTIDYGSFNLERKFFNHTQYFPYISNRIVNETLKENGYNTAVLNFLPFYEFTEYDDYTRGNSIKGLLEKTEMDPGEFHYKGYISNTNDTIKSEEVGVVRKTILFPKISEGSIDILKSIVDTCRKKSIKIIFTYAPEYNKVLQKSFGNFNDVIHIIETIANENHIPYWRHDYLDICKRKGYFANAGHLNTKGAEVYSIVLANQLKAYLEQNPL